MRYDLHVHSKYSKCSNLNPLVILKTAKRRGLNGIAITDHNTIKGALEVSRLNKDKFFEVIIGEEIDTDKGEVLGLYLKKEIKKGNFYEVVKEIKKQGGIAIIAHPYSITRTKAKSFEEIDAVEGFNSRNLFKFENLKAQIKAKELGLGVTAGSDSHFKFEIGRAYTEFEGSLKDAVKNKKTKIYGRQYLAFLAGVKTVFQKYFLRFFVK